MSLFRDFISLIEIVLNVREGRIIPQFRTLNHSRTIIEVSFETPKPYAPSLFAKAKAIREWEGRSGVEVIFQADIPERKNKKLVVFDMDSTLIQQEVIDEIARKLGVEKEVSAITERAMNGELDFTASLHARCALLKGVPSTVFTELRDVITLTPGAKDLVHVLKRLGYKTAVLSGGFTPLTSWQAEQLKLDYAFANHLEVSPDGSTLTGIVTGDIVNAERKREHLLAIAEKEGIALEEVLAVGDGANDLQMMGVAGLGVAFNAKPKVQVEAPARLNGKSLLDVLYLLGYTEEEVEGLLR
ncbi:phosphoserine phosphatase serb [Tothia fuscella]|uniref:phosphoserine phosphatase n=1 Tax=Tothia fuscella TaxID=1048955 RepID=A0A9P4NN73_9PEZI|nr:phosphoserine phosphatase serb [Tothia fuscella]